MTMTPDVNMSVVDFKNTKLKEKLNLLWDEESHNTASMERAYMEKMGGGCHAPMGASCEMLSNGEYRLHAMFGTENGERIVYSDVSGEDRAVVLEETIRNIKEQMRNETE